MKADQLKLLFVYGNCTFVIVAGFYVLFQLAVRPDLPPEASSAVGVAAIFGGFVGTVLQFLTGSEIATRATRASADSFASGLATPTPPVTTTVTSEGPPVTSTTVTTGAPAPEEAPDGNA
jgi:hypothetical protein